jgi:carbonic anhydrase
MIRLSVKTISLGLAAVAAFAFIGVDHASADLINQSPIDIITNDVVRQLHFKTIDFNYSNDTTLTVKNVNSPNVEGTIRGIPSAGSTLSYDGYVYNLLQFHFHEEAEHTINGYRAPMEIHFVNQQAGSSAADGLLVVGRFIEVIAQDNPLLIDFFSGISSIPNPNDQFVINTFDVAALLPTGQAEYRYTGSLTTDPYSQPVDWNVFVGIPLYLSQNQIDQFAAAFPYGNAREVQPLDGRTVYTAAVPEIDPNSLGSVLALVLGSLGLLERRRLKAA